MTIILCICLATNIFAQKDVTKFLGIPVDGSKSEFRQKLIKKGFKYDRANDMLTGRFNGQDVNVYIGTNNDKVYRVYIADKNYTDEAGIKIRFNKLVNQFLNNDKYIGEDYSLAEDVDISYEMMAHKKRFDASFYQVSEDFVNLKKFDQSRDIAVLNQLIGRYYTEEEIESWSELELPEEEVYASKFDSMLTMIANSITKKSVWFMISEYYGKYYISMYYDNVYNMANGEDL